MNIVNFNAISLMTDPVQVIIGVFFTCSALIDFGEESCNVNSLFMISKMLLTDH